MTAPRRLTFFAHFLVLLLSLGTVRGEETAIHDDFASLNPAQWAAQGGQWSIEEGRLLARGGFARLLHSREMPQDFEISAAIAYQHEEAHAAAGLQFRLGDDMTGYAVCLREIEKGMHPELGPWERPVLQLFRMDPGGWKLLQESKVMGVQSGVLSAIKVIVQGPNLFVFHNDMTTPVFREFDGIYNRPGRIALWKDHAGSALFDNFTHAKVGKVPPPPPPLRTDWSWVRGVIYVRSNAVNSVEMWHDYWPHTDVIDRELSYAASYGLNMVQVYLHWIVWNQHQDEYLKRIDDFLERAAKHGLKVNLILWDDCGHVEPSLVFAPPVPGRHNSQMMPNPSHRIRNSETEMTAHQDRFRTYVEGVARRFKDDARISFWQLYNECMGPKELYRTGEADANLNRLLAWTREWVKGTGTAIPVTATGGGFYGPKYSDFYTYHSYRSGDQPLPNADGGPEHLCTEALNRPFADVAECVRGLGGKWNGFVIWELMIGRDQCRYPWGHPDGPAEPTNPFHGIVYPDGHPWEIEEVKALLGENGYASLLSRVFQVEYFAGAFESSKKLSITPRIDFDLGDEPGYGSPDASAGLGRDAFSIRWTGHFDVRKTGIYTFIGESDGAFRLWINENEVIERAAGDVAGEVISRIDLTAGNPYAIRVEYTHVAGDARCRLWWSGPGIEKQAFQPVVSEPRKRGL